MNRIMDKDTISLSKKCEKDNKSPYYINLGKKQYPSSIDLEYLYNSFHNKLLILKDI